MSVEVRRAIWRIDAPRIQTIRHAVFVLEQSVDRKIEWDGRDPDCEHVLALCGAEYVATGRLQADGRIGRMAVLAAHRGRGYGSAILTELLAIAAESGLPVVSLHAQIHALSFYTNHGFVRHGPDFDEAGIAHCRMQRSPERP